MSHLHTPDGRLSPWAQRLVRWLLAGLLLATLAPGVSRALAAGGPPHAQPGETWVELCTRVGMQWVRLDLNLTDGDAAPDPAPLDRCGHCTLAAERFAALLPALPVLPLALAHGTVPVQRVQPRVDAPTRAAQARGPPLLG